MLSSKVMLQLLLLIWWLMVVLTSWERRKSSFFLVHWIHIEPSLGHPWEPSHVQVFLCFSGDKSACLLKDYPRVFHILSFPTFSPWLVPNQQFTEVKEGTISVLAANISFSTGFKIRMKIHILQEITLRKSYVLILVFVDHSLRKSCRILTINKSKTFTNWDGFGLEWSEHVSTRPLLVFGYVWTKAPVKNPRVSTHTRLRFVHWLVAGTFAVGKGRQDQFSKKGLS